MMKRVIAERFDGLNRRLAARFGYDDFTRFVVLTRSRTGSSLLMSFLRSHPQVRVYGEYFSRLNGRPYQSMLGEVFSRHPRKIKAVGFKIFYNQPFDDPDSELWQALSEIRELRVVHLTRINFLRTYVSRRIADEQEVWSLRGNKTQGRSQAPVLVIKPEELQSAYEKTRQLQARRELLFADHRLLSLTYESLVAQPQSEFKRITDFLDLAERPPVTSLRRQNTRKLSEIISNYAELRASLSGAELESFFEE